MIFASLRLTRRPVFQSFKLVCLFGVALAAILISGCGGFTTCTLTLAPYDLFSGFRCATGSDHLAVESQYRHRLRG